MSGLLTYEHYKINAHTYTEMYFEHLPHESISTSSCQTGWPSPRGAAEATEITPREANRPRSPTEAHPLRELGCGVCAATGRPSAAELRLSPHRS